MENVYACEYDLLNIKYIYIYIYIFIYLYIFIIYHYIIDYKDTIYTAKSRSNGASQSSVGPVSQESVSRTPKWALLRSPPLLVSCEIKENVGRIRGVYAPILQMNGNGIDFEQVSDRKTSQTEQGH